MSWTARTRVLWIIGVLALIGCQPAKPLYTEVPLCEPRFESVGEPVEQMRESLGLSGAGLLLIWKGQTVCEIYYGRYDQQTEIPLVSAAKWLSAATILTLVDAGLLALDDPVGKYLPYFSGEKGKITLRQLLSHTSGLEAYHPCMFQRELALDICAREIAAMDLLGPPGTQFDYGGAAFTVAGRMAEVSSHEPWAEIFRKQLAEPLGLTATDYGATLNPILSEGYVNATLREYGRFLLMIFQKGQIDGKRILSEGAIREMLHDQTNGATIDFSPRNPSIRYGLGVWRDKVDPDGNALFVTSPGGGGFLPWIDFEHQVIGIVMFYDRIERVWPAFADAVERVEKIIEQAP